MRRLPPGGNCLKRNYGLYEIVSHPVAAVSPPSNFNTAAVSSRVGDVRLLLVFYFPRMQCQRLQIMLETSKNWRCIPIVDFFNILLSGSLPSLLQFTHWLNMTRPHTLQVTRNGHCERFLNSIMNCGKTWALVYSQKNPWDLKRNLSVELIIYTELTFWMQNGICCSLRQFNWKSLPQ